MINGDMNLIARPPLSPSLGPRKWSTTTWYFHIAEGRGGGGYVKQMLGMICYYSSPPLLAVLSSGPNLKFLLLLKSSRSMM